MWIQVSFYLYFVFVNRIIKLWWQPNHYTIVTFTTEMIPTSITVDSSSLSDIYVLRRVSRSMEITWFLLCRFIMHVALNTKINKSEYFIILMRNYCKFCHVYSKSKFYTVTTLYYTYIHMYISNYEHNNTAFNKLLKVYLWIAISGKSMWANYYF